MAAGRGAVVALARVWLARLLLRRALAFAATVVLGVVVLLVVLLAIGLTLGVVLLTTVARAAPAAATPVAAVPAAATPIAAGGSDAARFDAATSDAKDVVRRYDATITVDGSGTATVVLDLDVDFGTEPNRGPFLTYVVREVHDDTRDRVYRLTDVQATSSTGAADEVHLQESGGLLEIRIGDPDRQDLTGVHSYRVTFQAEGWVDTAETSDGDTDELYLDVVGDGWEVPLEDVRVAVHGPADVVAARCFTPDGGCSGDHTGRTAVFRQDGLAAGEPLTVAVAWPAGTFGDVQPILQERWAASRAFAVTPWTVGVSFMVVGSGLWWLVHRVRTHGRDAPAGAHGGHVGVQVTPPPGLRPGQLGTLVDERADPHDVTATLVDLAVRGYLVIQAMEPSAAGGSTDGDPDWRLMRTDEPHADLRPFEAALLDHLFAQRAAVTLSDLTSTSAEAMGAVQDALYQDVTARGWFRGNPAEARASWGARAALLLLGGVVLTVLLALWTSWALVGLAVVVVGVVMAVTTGAAPARTAGGTAVLAQAEAFRRHLETVDPQQVRVERGDDVVGSYLPFAVAFGLTERWGEAIDRPVAQGHPAPRPTWYVGYHPAQGAGGTFGRDLARFTDAADAAIAAPAPKAGGGSGVSAGRAGGGVGGGGGGTW